MNDDAPGPDPLVIFATAVIGLLLCQILCPLAWALGNRYMHRALRAGVEPDPMARLGRTVGVVGTLLWGTSAFLAVAGGLVAYAWMR